MKAPNLTRLSNSEKLVNGDFLERKNWSFEMNTKIIATVVSVLSSASAGLSDSGEHLWELSVGADVFPVFCRFSDNINVELVYDSPSGRFLLETPGSVSIQSNMIDRITYSTGGTISYADGGVIGEGLNWDLSEVSLSGADGNVPSKETCTVVDIDPDDSENPTVSICQGIEFDLPSDAVDSEDEFWTLDVRGGSVSPPLGYVPAFGDKLRAIFSIACYQN